MLVAGDFTQHRAIAAADDQHHQDLIIFENAAFGRVMALDGVVQTTERDEFIYHGNGFDMLVAGDFTQHRAIAAADDQHVLCVTMGQHILPLITCCTMRRPIIRI
jgi:spermidine synthase